MLPSIEPILVTRTTSVRDGSPKAMGAMLLAYSYHLSRGEPDQAGEELDYALEEVETLAAVVRPMSGWWARTSSLAAVVMSATPKAGLRGSGRRGR